MKIVKLVARYKNWCKVKLLIDNLSFSNIFLFFSLKLFEIKTKHYKNWYKTCTLVYRTIEII